MDTSCLASDNHRRVGDNDSLQKQLFDARNKLDRTEADLSRLAASLERLHSVSRDCEQKLEKFTHKRNIIVRQNRSHKADVYAIEAEIAFLDRESKTLELEAEQEVAISNKLETVRAGVKRDGVKYQRLLVAQAQKLSNLSIQVKSAKETLNLLVESTQSRANQLLSLHKNVETLEAILGVSTK